MLVELICNDDDDDNDKDNTKIFGASKKSFIIFIQKQYLLLRTIEISLQPQTNCSSY